MSDANKSTSLVKVIGDIIDKKIDASSTKTNSGTLLFKAGSTLTPINLGRLSY